MLKEGSTAPAFKTKDGNGETVNLKDLRGQKVALYFYPKDDTPGCTKEACSFRDAFSKFKKKGIAVLGVSPDSEASHKKFATKYSLPFTLLADTDHSIAESYGVWGEKKFMGRTYMGVHRTTFLIDEKGKIRKIFEKVKPEDHASEVLGAFAESTEDVGRKKRVGALYNAEARLPPSLRSFRVPLPGSFRALNPANN